MNKAVDESVNELIKSGLVKKDALKGCNDSEINTLESTYKISLPKDYVYFLQLMGKDSATFLKGTDFLYEKLFKLKEHAIDLLKENNANYHLRENDFVFMSHQGYQFLFFKCNTNDASIYYYEDGEEDVKEVYPNFEAWFKDTVKDEIESFQTL